jgi:hypothetical protein
MSTHRLTESMNEMWLSKITHAARSQISSGFGVKSNIWWCKWTCRLAAVLLQKLGTLERVNASHRGKTMAVIPCVKPHAESVNNPDLKCTKSGKNTKHVLKIQQNTNLQAWWMDNDSLLMDICKTVEIIQNIYIYVKNKKRSTT